MFGSVGLEMLTGRTDLDPALNLRGLGFSKFRTDLVLIPEEDILLVCSETRIQFRNGRDE